MKEFLKTHSQVPTFDAQIYYASIIESVQYINDRFIVFLMVETLARYYNIFLYFAG